MGHTVARSTISNRQILEGLWAQGVDPNKLSGIDPGGSQTDFLARLHDSGISPDQTTRATNLVAWRPDAGNVNDFIKTLQMEGVSTDQIRQVITAAQRQAGQPGIRTAGQQLDFLGLPGLKDLGAIKLDPGELANAASSVLSPQQASQARIKTGQTQGLTSDQWNPFRDDRPQAAPVAPAPYATGHEGSALTHPSAPPGPAPAPPPKAPPKPGTPAPAAAAPLLSTSDQGVGIKALPKNANDAQVEQYLRENYGSDTWVLQVPEIKKIVFDALKNPSGVSQGIIDSAVQKTTWWQQNGKNVADFLQEQSNSGSTLNAKILGHQRDIDSRAAALGITLTPEKNLELATNWQKWQWDDNAVNAALSGEFHYQKGQQTVFTDKLQTEAKNYLVPVSDDTIQQWGQKIIANPNEAGNFTEFLKNQAKSMFPSFAGRLDTENMQQIASGYGTIAGQYLEMDPKDINWMDPKWMAALDQVDDKGNHTSMSLSDWTRKVKDDTTYGYDRTEQAKQGAASMATDLLKKFGAIA